MYARRRPAVRPGSAARNSRRPKVYFHTFPQAVYSRSPSGGPLRGGTTLTVVGENLNGYLYHMDKIFDELVAQAGAMVQWQKRRSACRLRLHRSACTKRAPPASRP